MWSLKIAIFTPDKLGYYILLKIIFKPFDLALLLVCLMPTLALSVQGSTSTIMYTITLFFLLSLKTNYKDYRELWADFKLLFFISLLYPIYICLQMIGLDIWKGSKLEYVLRFLQFIPLLSVLTVSKKNISVLFGLSCAVGAILACIYAVISIVVPSLAFGDGTRAWNFYTNPIPFGNMSLLLGFLSLTVLLVHQRGLKITLAIILLFGFLGGGVASLLSGTRGGWVAIPVLLLIMFLLSRRKNSEFINLKLMLLAIGLFLVTTLIFSEILHNRFDSLYSDLTNYFGGGPKYTSVGARLEMWLAALRLWIEHPLFGVGVGQLKLAMNELVQVEGFSSHLLKFSHSHNDFVFVLAEQGLVGLFLFMSYYLFPLYYFLSFIKKGNKEQHCLSLMGIIVVVAFLIFGLTEAMQVIMFQLSFYLMIITLLMSRLWRSSQIVSSK